MSPDTVIIKDTICYGTDYTQNGFTISNAKTDSVYFNNDFNTNGCDSVTRLELMVNPLILTQIKDTICQGKTYDFNGKILTIAKTYYDTLHAINGCDSIIKLILTVNSIITRISENICEGGSYDFFGHSLTQSGVYYKILQTIDGCDSIIELTLMLSVGINNYELPITNYVIYPNPTDGKLRITGYPMSDMRLSDIKIYDIVGKLQIVESRISEIGKSEIEIDISHLANGIYSLKVGDKTVKVIKMW